MSRATTIHKLANAIKLYRGARTGDGKDDKSKWVRGPQLSQHDNIRRLLANLSMSVAEQDIAIARINALKTYPDFNEWIKKLY